MKKIITTLVLITIALSLTAQAPHLLSYQAVARDGAGNLLTNQLVSCKISILQGNPSGDAVFLEWHEIVTSQTGLINLEIGSGEPGMEPLSEIDWANGPYYLQLEMDPNGGNNYQLMGTSQLLSVPYSLYSEATGDTTRWKKNNDDLYFNNGNVGIGTDSPLSWAKLDVRGNFSVDGYTLISRMDGSEVVLELYNTISDWELVAASDNNRFDIRKWGGVPALSITDNNNIGIGTENPDESALLDLNSNSKGFLPPCLTDAEIEAIASPTDGLTVYNKDWVHYTFMFWLIIPGIDCFLRVP